MNSLHDKILNIPFINRVFNKKEEKTAYRIGHHDAIQAAASLIVDDDLLNHELLMALDYLYSKKVSVCIPRIEKLIAKAKGHKNDK